jgi:hypothetical protein
MVSRLFAHCDGWHKGEVRWVAMGKYFAEKHIGGPQLFIELERRRARRFRRDSTSRRLRRLIATCGLIGQPQKWHQETAQASRLCFCGAGAGTARLSLRNAPG